jgi:hypothetical protein
MDLEAFVNGAAEDHSSQDVKLLVFVAGVGELTTSEFSSICYMMLQQNSLLFKSPRTDHLTSHDSYIFNLSDFAFSDL